LKELKDLEGQILSKKIVGTCTFYWSSLERTRRFNEWNLISI